MSRRAYIKRAKTLRLRGVYLGQYTPQHRNAEVHISTRAMTGPFKMMCFLDVPVTFGSPMRKYDKKTWRLLCAVRSAYR